MARTQLSESKFALLVQGEALDMGRISRLLELEPTRTVRKGELLNRLPEIRADSDEWIYAIQLSQPNGFDPAMNQLLAQLCSHADRLKDIQGQVSLRLSVQSDYAQMVYSLMPETLQRLAEIGLPLEVSSLSWGEVGI